MSDTIIAADVGNSRIKLGLFARSGSCGEALRQSLPTAPPPLPEPLDTLDVPLTDPRADFNEQELRDWCRTAPAVAGWLVASVHRQAAEHLRRLATELAGESGAAWLQELSYTDLPIDVRVPEPQRVGIDRVAAAAAANRLRAPDHAAVVVDHGTAITVDLVQADGAFVGGAILPGMAMAARALAENTDALPHVAVEGLHAHIPVIGNATVPAIEAGLFWGTYGAVRELVTQIAQAQSSSTDVYFTGGGARSFSQRLSADTGLVTTHVPHLVLAGIALASPRGGNG